MAAKSTQRSSCKTDSYLALIHRLPLKPIKDDGHHARALEIIGELLGRKVDSGTADYLDTLIVLVNKYEDENHTPMGDDLSPQEAVRAIMRANGISQTEMGGIIGSESTMSMFLKGKRELSKAQIKALVGRFRVDAGLFF